MIYDDLDKIPMNLFMDIFQGDISKVSDENIPSVEAEEIAERLIAEYSEIVGGRSAIAEVSKQNEIYNCGLKIECMNACEYLIKAEKYESVSKILLKFGFKIPAEDKDRIRQRVSSILTASQYRIEKLKSFRPDADSQPVNKDYFTRERVMLMENFKMHIDIYKLSAKEYAYMVRKTCDDMQSVLKNIKKKK